MRIEQQIILQRMLPIIFFATTLLQSTIAQHNSVCKILISNQSLTNVENKVVEIPWEKVLKKMNKVDTGMLVVMDEKLNQLPLQFETKGTGRIQNLLVQVSVPSNSAIRIQITKGKRTAFSVKTFCRFVPERYDDFAWENDKIAFRMYGKALEATTFNAFGIDVWTKRTNQLVINKWYKSEDYHIDHGDGLDFYGVGYSLGAGNITPFLEDSIYYSQNYSRYEILDNGPLRSSFKLYYDNWPVGNFSAIVNKTIQLNAGDQLNKIEAVFKFNGIDSLSVAIGINKKNGADIKVMNEQHQYLGYWLPPDFVNGTIGVGCVLAGSSFEMKYFNKHLLAVQNAKSNVPVVYYAGACWDKDGYFSNEQIWFDYLKKFSAAIKQPLVVSVE